MDYQSFLQTKRLVAESAGIEVNSDDIHPMLFDWQNDITRWALKRGRAAIFADCGLGKTLMQLEWARHIGGQILIVCPLSVADQTIREGAKIGLAIRYVRDGSQLAAGINITNYEMIRHFIGAYLDGIVLDESSILKSIDGKTRKMLLAKFTSIPYRLCCTATPCPNDIAEIANHSEFLGVMPRNEMLSSFFVHDQDGWRLRGHAAKPFYKWLASWAMAFKSPADIGYDANGFNLPSLKIIDVIIQTDWRRPGHLFAGDLRGITDRASVRKQSVRDRVLAASQYANEASGQVIVWCGLNTESSACAKTIDGAVEIVGSETPEAKSGKILSFIDGKIRVIVTKLKIAGFGMNFQNATTMIFMGMSDSYEAYYQGIRRCWRFGQKSPVSAYIVVTDHEQEIVENVRRKEREAEKLSYEIIQAAREYEMDQLHGIERNETFPNADYSGEAWKILQGDSVDRIAELADNSIDLSIFSPPFLSLYTYSPTERDLGNSKNDRQFFEHFRFIIDGLMRITKPGRLCCVHCSQVPTTLVNHGIIGMKDFRGNLLESFVSRDWIYHGEVCIDKDPQAQAIRTHSKGLLFVQLKKDASWLRPAMADYILVFRKPGDNIVPIHPDITNDEWIEWARPIWYGIRESETLNAREARSDEDDRHICALQLGTIERVIRLWSNPGEMVFSPFAGIGSEGYMAIKTGRRFIGIELKPLYAKTAAKSLTEAERETETQGTLFAINQ